VVWNSAAVGVVGSGGAVFAAMAFSQARFEPTVRTLSFIGLSELGTQAISLIDLDLTEKPFGPGAWF
jgi:hypothetical protein